MERVAMSASWSLTPGTTSAEVTKEGTSVRKRYGVWKTSNHQDVYYVLAMELLGKSLHDLLKSNWYGLFRLRTVMMLADQVLEILEFLHTQFILPIF
jgi:serine/threonine protein kinase